MGETLHDASTERRDAPRFALRAAFENDRMWMVQLTMNTRRAPGRVLGDHPEDESVQFPAHTLSSRSGLVSRKPLPIQLEAGPMPSNNRFRLDQEQHPIPSGTEPSQDHPEDEDAFVEELQAVAAGSGFPKSRSRRE